MLGINAVGIDAWRLVIDLQRSLVVQSEIQHGRESMNETSPTADTHLPVPQAPVFALHAVASPQPAASCFIDHAISEQAPFNGFAIEDHRVTM